MCLNGNEQLALNYIETNQEKDKNVEFFLGGCRGEGSALFKSKISEAIFINDKVLCVYFLSISVWVQKFVNLDARGNKPSNK